METDTPQNTEAAGATPGRASPQANVRPRKDYPFLPDTLTGLSPLPGYGGSLALVPTGATSYRVALFVAGGTKGGVAWLAPRGTVIMDVPDGFPIDDGDAILHWMQRSQEDGKPGPPGSVTGITGGTDPGAPENTATAGATPSPAPQRPSVPSVRPRKDYPFVPDTLTGLSPVPGYAAAVALVPTGATSYRVALCVAGGTKGGITWLPPRGAAIMDVPDGFPVHDGDAILRWLKQSEEDSKPGPPGSVTG